MNALTLPPALCFNQTVAEREIARFGEALGTDDPIRRTQELAHLGGYKRLRDQGVPEDELDAVAEAAAIRAGAKANPRPATASQISALLRSIY
jgi:alcohol dehydrogenase class IV